METEKEVKFTLPKSGEGLYVVAYINSQKIDAPSVNELVASTLTRFIGDISICHDNYGRPNGYIFIRAIDHTPVTKPDVDRFRASTFNHSPITARLFENEDEFKEYLSLFSSSILKKIPVVPPPSQVQFFTPEMKYRPPYHRIFLSGIPDEEKFNVKLVVSEYVPFHKFKLFLANEKDYAEFVFLKVNDAKNLLSLYKQKKIKLGTARMYPFLGTVESNYLLVNNVTNPEQALKLIGSFGNMEISQFISNSNQLIIKMEKLSSAARAACILKNENNIQICTIHEGYFKQLTKKNNAKPKAANPK